MKQLTIYTTALIVILFSSCTGKTIPSGKLPKIIAEIYLVDKYANEAQSISPFAHLDSIKIYEPIFNKYGYTGEDYKRSIEKYISRPKKLAIYYRDAKTILEEQKKSIQSRVAEQMQMDSLLQVYTSAMSNNNAKLRYYKNIRNNKWIYFPHSDSRWPLGEAPSDIALPIGYNPFQRIERNFVIPYLYGAANIQISSGGDPGEEYIDLSQEHINLSQEAGINIGGNSPDESNTFYKRHGRKKFPVWPFQSDTSIDTLQLGSGINYRMLLQENLAR